MPVGPHLPINLYAMHGKPIPETIASGWMALARHPSITAFVKSILGPNIILWGTQLFNKSPRHGLEIPWHQDGHYWPIYPSATCSVWVSIDAANAENGAMGWIPRSHAPRRIFGHNIDNSEALGLNQVLDFRHTALDEAEAKLNVLEAGQLSLHDVFLVHNSGANTSLHRRAAFVLRYMPCSSVFDPGRLPIGRRTSSTANFRRPLCLVAGEPLENANYPGLLDARASAPSKDAVDAAWAAIQGN